MHAFTASALNKALCVHCKRDLRAHTAIAQCEACPKVGPCELFADILMCAKCYSDELAAQAALKEGAEARVAASKQATLDAQAAIRATQPMSVNDLVDKAQKIDTGQKLVADMYNAQTVALKDIVKAINDDTAIENKSYARYKAAHDRRRHFQSLIFELEDKILDAKQGFRVSQEYMNQTINELRESEREEFRQSDMTYQVKTPKASKPKSQGTKKVKASTKPNMVEAQKWGAKIGQSMNAIHAIMVQHGVDAKGAARILCGLLGKPFPEE